MNLLLDGVPELYNPQLALPNYIDDVLSYNDYKSLPEKGEIGNIYVTLDDGNIYRWSDDKYIKISAATTDIDRTDIDRTVLTYQRKFKDECPCCGAKSFEFHDDYYKCNYCDSMFSYK